MSVDTRSWPNQENGNGEYTAILSLFSPRQNLGQLLLGMSNYDVFFMNIGLASDFLLGGGGWREEGAIP